MQSANERPAAPSASRPPSREPDRKLHMSELEIRNLYVRAGKSDRAIEQFVRIADHQFSEGFFPKSAALYKKALKLQPDQEHILMQLASIGERQGKFVDAKQYLRQVARQREARGERRAAAECILRLGSLPNPFAFPGLPLAMKT